jgi:hypothetical protein
MGRINQERLVEACVRVRQLEFSDYKKDVISRLQKSSKFLKRLDTLEGNWAKLQEINFSIMKLNVAKFMEVIDGELMPVVTNQLG